MVGNPHDLPQIAPHRNFGGFALIDALTENRPSELDWKSIRNFFVNASAIPSDPTEEQYAVRLSGGKGNSLHNVVIELSREPGTNQIGIQARSGDYPGIYP